MQHRAESANGLGVPGSTMRPIDWVLRCGDFKIRLPEISQFTGSKSPCLSSKKNFNL
jgi:hypothetical protein